MKKSPTLKAFSKILLDKGTLGRTETKILQDNTLWDYKNRLTGLIWPQMGKYRLSDLNHGHIIDFEAKMAKKGLSVASRRHYITVLRNIFESAKRRGLIQQNPTIDLAYTESINPNIDPDLISPAQETVPVYSELEIRKYVDTALRLYPIQYGPQGLFCVLCALTGVRLSEGLGLKWKDVSVFKTSGPTININRKMSKLKCLGATKSKSAIRTVPIPHQLASLLRKWRFFCDHPDSGIKENEMVFPIGYHSYNLVHKRVIKESGLPYIPFKNLRTSYSTNFFLNLRARNEDEVIQELARISRIMGHSSFDVTWKHYVKIKGEECLTRKQSSI